jgi:FtsH-binding integral membrane protein
MCLKRDLLFAIVYPIVGVTFAIPANSAVSNEVRFGWRLAAWLVSALTFAIHIAYEHFRARNLPLRAASHVAGAVALGAFLLAVWVNFRHQSTRALLALIVFPVVTGVPAFVMALVTLAVLARVAGRDRSRYPPDRGTSP